MSDASDNTLLREFAGRNSESAFAELVRRHINLVYSVALRCTNNDGDAKDVTQSVFITLARKAAGLREDTVLTGWLYETTRFTASRLLRSHARRRAHEQEAYMQSTLDGPGHEDLWRQLAPHLEAAMSRLGERDRTLLALRFYENKTGAESAVLLGIREEAARKRTNRALEKLRRFFSARGVTSTTAAIAGAISAHSVAIAPPGLISSVVAASLAGTAGVGSVVSVSLLTKFLLMKKAIAIATLLVLAASITSVGAVKFARYRAADAPVTETKIKQGLVLHLTFDQDETGGSVTDSSGIRNNGTATGVHWKSDGKKGGAYEFTKDGDQIIVPNNPSLNPGQFTLSAWIKTTTGDYYWRRIFDKSYSKEFALSVAGDWQQNNWRGCVSMEIGPGTHFVITKNKINDGQWHHVVCTFDGMNEIVYVDGQVGGQAQFKKSTKAGTSDFDLVIGCNRSNLTKKDDDLGVSFRGMIDEPMVWNRALSAKEIAFLYHWQNSSASAVALN